MAEMIPIFSAHDYRRFDKEEREVYGITVDLLMYLAGYQIYHFIRERFPEGTPIIFLCGTGNNGSDGICASTFFDPYWRERIEIWLWRQGLKKGEKEKKNIIEKSSPDPPGDRYFKLARRLNIAMRVVSSPAEVKRHLVRIGRSVLVDGLFGTGLSRSLGGEDRELIEVINRNRKIEVISIDCPSGLNCDTGAVMGALIKADHTITLEGEKLGFFNPKIQDHLGSVEVGKIGIHFPEDLGGHPYFKVEEVDILSLLKRRKRFSHKGTYGRALVISGSLGMSGAPRLVVRSLMRVGAGMVKLLIPESIYLLMATLGDEVMISPMPCNEKGSFSEKGIDEVREYIEWADHLVIGPGIGASPDALKFVKYVIEKSDLPCVIDADALRVVPSLRFKRGREVILTPHPGEFARMSGIREQELFDDPFTCLSGFAVKNRSHLLLKSNRNMIAAPDGKIYFVATGSPALATAGSGDVLTGMIGGYFTQGHGALDSAILGAYIHGLAGEIGAEEMGESGLLSSDLAELIPKAVSRIRG